MYYSAGVVSTAAFGGTLVLPHQGGLWVAARLMLDGAGGLFGLYLLVGFLLAVVGSAVRLRAQLFASRPRPQK
jgi:hypothetical protein